MRPIRGDPRWIRDEEGALPAAIEMLRHLPKGASGGVLLIKKIDGTAAKDSPLREQFMTAGYATDYQGLIDLRPPGTKRPEHADNGCA